MKDRARAAIATCRLIATMSEEPGRTTRRFLTPPMHEVHFLLRTRMEELGMSVSMDALGNLRGVHRPTTAGPKSLLMGSHIDTVPNAGAFDGVLGVVLSLEWVALARELALPLAIEVIAFSEEEGVRFGVPFLGSRAVAGRFDEALLALTDAQGMSLEAAICAFGLDPKGIGAAALDEHYLGFVEIHIEQGPVLEAEGLQVAVVAAIVGQSRLDLSFKGQSNHAGTTPMHLRRDALAAACEWITAVEELAQRTEELVATVGKLHVEPNAGNVIPGMVRLSLDLRHTRDAVRAVALKTLLDRAVAIANRRGIEFESTTKLEHPAVPMDERLSACLADALQAAGFPRKEMPSGAGHDAMVMATRWPTAMLFLRSPGGVSHHPDETVLEEDVEAALRVGSVFLLRLSQQIG